MASRVVGVLRAKARDLSRRFGRDASLMFLARILQNANGFLLSVAIVRRFGLAAAGTLTIATIATVVIALLGTFGLPYVFARTDAPIGVKNALGFAAALIVVPLSLPFILLLSALASHGGEEMGVIALLSLGGPFFAQGNLLSSLQVLQGKAGQSIIAPAANSLGLVVATLFGSSYLLFAAILALFRFAGSLAAFLCLERTPVDWRLFLDRAREGRRFLVGDSINLGVEQLTVLIVSFLMSRSDLGLFGLCRQMLTVSDTPGWSQMQAKYPDAVADPEGTLPELRRLMLRLGAGCAAAVAVLAIPLGLFVFHLPRFVLLAPLMLTSTPLRYLLSTYDLHLRAIGALDRVSRVSAIRGALALVVIPAGAALCLAAYCRYEALFNLTLPCVFLFVFIGAAVAAPEPAQSAPPPRRRARRARSLRARRSPPPRALCPPHGANAFRRPAPMLTPSRTPHDADAAPPESPAPVLSVVIPAYNVARYIEAAAMSALGQTYRNLEVIVVDDGSTDETPRILENLARRCADPRLRVVRQPNGGLSAARNAGVEHARGAFIGFLDGDDVWLPQKAALQISSMQRNPEIGISFSHSEYMTELGERTGSILLAGKAAPSLHDMVRRNHVGNGSTAIVRRECFEKTGLFRPDLRSCEDYEMWCRILWSTDYVAALVPLPLTLYRLRESSLSFNSMTFVENSDRAMACLRREMPHLPERILRIGHAEHYRIAAWKAVSCGRHLDALKLMARAVAMRPLFLVADWRALGTAVAIVVPARARGWLASTAKSLQKSYYRVAPVRGS